MKKGSVGTIIVNKKFAEIHQINISKAHKIFFGLQSVLVKIKVKAFGEVDCSDDILKKLKVPTGFDFDIIYKKGKFYIGPYLGIVVSKNDKYITKKRLEILKDYCMRQKKNGGLIAFFALDSVNLSAKEMVGHIYSKNGYQKIILPMPDMIFRRTIIGKSFGKKFLDMGIRVFNYPVLNKWKVYQHLISSSELYVNLPYTILYTNKKDISKMLSNFSVVYIKPINKLGGSGIYKVTKTDNKYIIQGTSNRNENIEVDSLEEIFKYLDGKISKRQYIIQEGIDIVLNNESVIDFRIFVQKNNIGKWEVSRVIGKVGKQKCIVSNIAKGGKMRKAIETLEEEYDLDTNKAKEVLLRLENIALLACNQFDLLKGNYALLGVDIALDKNLNIYILEINHMQNGLYVKNNTFKPYYIAMIKGNVGDYGRYLYEN